MSLPEPPEGLRDSIRRIAAAAERGSRSEINKALIDFEKLVDPVLRRYTRSQLEKKRVGGPDGLIAEVGDIHNELLYLLSRVARLCTASDDDSAQYWLKDVLKHLVEDQAKTPRRRLANQIKRLRGLGYDHDSWPAETDDRSHDPDQEPDHEPSDA